MKTLVTGGHGMIGSQFKGRGYTSLSSKDCDLRSPFATNYIIELHNPDVVIHTAAKVGGVGANMNYMGEFFYDNILINTNVIESARLAGVKKLVAFLSTCVFPNDVEYPLTEDKIHSGEPHHTNFGYAYSKRMVDVMLRSYNKQYGLNYFSIIPCNVYGPNDYYNLENGHVIPTLIHKCYLAKKNGTDLEVWGDGTPLREFIYSKDLAHITTLLLEKYDGVEPVIVSNPTEVSIREVVELITKIMEFEGKVVWKTDKPNGQYRKPSSIQKLKGIIGEYEFTPLEVGLRESIDWFIQNYETVRK
jgi:GDP-L-fucose synthase